MIVNAMRNYDLAAGRRERVADAVPLDLTALPAGTTLPTARGEGSDDEAARFSGANSSSSHDLDPSHGQAVPLDSETEEDRPTQRLMDPVSRICGTLPDGCDLRSFHEPPPPKSKQQTEARYAHEFVLQMREAVPAQTALPQHAKQIGLRAVSESSAIAAADKQRVFFKSFDMLKLNVDLKVPLKVAAQKDDLDVKIGTAASKMNVDRASGAYQPSPTIVIEAAIFC